METETNIDITQEYLKEVSLQGDLLIDEEEFELGRRIQNGLKIINPNLPKNSNNITLTDDAIAARDELICRNLRLVVNLAAKHAPGHLLDGIQAGNLGLIRAAIKYDPEMKWRFSTFATWWIRQAIQRDNAENQRTIRIPVHEYERVNGIRKVENILTNILCRKPTLAELSVETGLSEEYLEEFFKLTAIPLELDKPVDDRVDAEEEGDFIAVDPVNVENVTLNNNRRRDIFEVFHELVKDKRSINIVLYRYGFFDGKTHTLDEIAVKAGISRERVRQIESNLFAKIRKSTKLSSKLHDYIEQND
jgi:RNA polymerase primary sigma factor